MKHLLRSLLFALPLAAAQPALAEFHTFQIEELYSNASGTIQYIVLHESQNMNGEGFLGGRTLSAKSTSSGLTKTFSFPFDLPGGSCDSYGYGCQSAATANKRVLIATASFNRVEPAQGGLRDTRRISGRQRRHGELRTGRPGNLFLRCRPTAPTR